MATTVTEIRDWFEYGRSKGQYTHMIVVCDTFDYDDFPVYFTGTADEVRAEVKRRNGINMEKVMEVYNFDRPMNAQLAQRRCFEY